MKNESKAYYLQVLGLSSNFNEIELKDAYRREAKKWHPDLQNENQSNKYKNKFIDITNAYKIILESLTKPAKT